MSKVNISFSEYYTYDKLTNYLHEVANAYPNLASLSSVGKSWEGRDIWALCLTDTSTGPAEHKPAIYIDGNIHAGEVTAAMVCLYTIHYLVCNYDSDEEVTHLLKTRTFYILPRVNPDGAELYLTTPYLLRSSVRPYPEGNIIDLPGLHPEDIDGNGHILQMRVRDDAKGEWRISERDFRLMLPRRPGERKGPFYRLFTEGFIKEHEGDDFQFHRTPWGLDLNRNFPSNWNTDTLSGGRYPTSEPEVKAIVDFIIKHNNIGALNAFHTTGGFYYRNPYTYGDEQMDPDDLRATKEIAREGFYVTGYSDVKSNNRSTLTEWAYEHRGIIGYTTELWDRLERAGVSREAFMKAETVEQQEEIGLKLLQWNDTELAGKGFIKWTPFDHPQLGQIDIGGWEPKYVVQNTPLHLLEQECHKNALWCLKQAAALPQLEICDVKIDHIQGDMFKVTAQIQNCGYLPTYITNKGKNTEIIKPDRAKLKGKNITIIHGKEEIDIGYLDGYMNGQNYRSGPAASVSKVSWIVMAPGNEKTCTIEVHSCRGGVAKKEAKF